MPCEFLRRCARASFFAFGGFAGSVCVCRSVKGSRAARCVSTCDTWLAEGGAFQIPVLTGACGGQPAPPASIAAPARTRRVHTPCRSAVSKQFSLCKASNLNNPGQERACIIAFAPREACRASENNFFFFFFFFNISAAATSQFQRLRRALVMLCC